jgi:hypothetical protein
MNERGKPAGFDPRTGEVHGSGSGAGGGGNPDEDYDDDPAAGFERLPVDAPRHDGITGERRKIGLGRSQRAHQDRGQSEIERAG